MIYRYFGSWIFKTVFLSPCLPSLSTHSRSFTFIYFNKKGEQSNCLSQAITGQGFWLLLTTFGTGLWKTFPFPLVNDRLFSLGKRHSTQSWWNFSLVIAGSWVPARSLDLDPGQWLGGMWHGQTFHKSAQVWPCNGMCFVGFRQSLHLELWTNKPFFLLFADLCREAFKPSINRNNGKCQKLLVLLGKRKGCPCPTFFWVSEWHLPERLIVGN